MLLKSRGATSVNDLLVLSYDPHSVSEKHNGPLLLVYLLQFQRNVAPLLWTYRSLCGAPRFMSPFPKLLLMYIVPSPLKLAIQCDQVYTGISTVLKVRNMCQVIDCGDLPNPTLLIKRFRVD